MVEGHKSGAEIDARPPCPENRRQAPDQLAGNSPVERNRQKTARENQTFSGTTVGNWNRATKNQRAFPSDAIAAL